MNTRDLRPLRHFVAVAEELHFGRAAARLYMTQPPLSQSIQALEQSLGMSLFSRTNRSVSLTPVGALWLPHVRRILAEAEGLAGIAERLARGEIGTLRLSFVSSTIYRMLPQLVSRFSAAFPEVEIVLQEATGDRQVQALLSHEIDAGLLIAPSHRTLPPGLSYLPLWLEPLIVAVPQLWIDTEMVTPAGDTLNLREMASLPLILFPRESSPTLHDLITSYFQQLALTPKLGQKAIQMQTIIGLVSAGIGFAIVPDAMRALARDGVAYFALAEAPPMMETGLALHPDTAPPAAHNFAQLALRNRPKARGESID